MKYCVRCNISDFDAPIHKHHKNGNHYDNSIENIILLCANCHMTLHWKRWKLSDIGLEDIKILDYRLYYPDKIPKKLHMLREMNEMKINIQALLVGIEYYHRYINFTLNIERNRNLEYYDAIMKGKFPYEVRHKFMQIDHKYQISWIDIRKNLDDLYSNYKKSCVGDVYDKIKLLEQINYEKPSDSEIVEKMKGLRE